MAPEGSDESQHDSLHPGQDAPGSSGGAAPAAGGADWPKVRNLERELAALDEHWFPRVIARVNDHFLKVAKVEGQLTWHAHETQDELFLVLRGRLRIQLEHDEVVLGEGDVWVVPAGMRHNPIAEEECWIALVEPVDTEHTGGEPSPLTRTIEEQLE